MRTRDVLRLVGATSLATAGLLSLSTSANAWAGLSAQQQAHIETIIHCNILMWTDIKQFEAEQPPCGGTPAAKMDTMVGGGGGTQHMRECQVQMRVQSISECPIPE
jgi:hypothetical protein